MLDIETMGNSTDVPVVAIGLVLYDPKKLITMTGEDVYDRFYCVIDLESNSEFGLLPDPSTVSWWLQQSEQARSIFSNTQYKVSLPEALNSLTEFTSEHCGQGHKGDHLLRLWGNGVAFDNVHLRNAFNACNVPCPYAFWNDACYRTLKNLHPEVKLGRVGVHHNALDDAETQMNHLLSILRSRK